MIRLDLADHSNKQLGAGIAKYINDNIAEIVRVLLDMLSEDPDFDLEGLLPWYYLAKHPDNKNRVRELYDILQSETVWSCVSPIYECLLYNILEWWEETRDEDEKLLPLDIPKGLLVQINDEREFDVIKILTDFACMKDVCFFDSDFLPDVLTSWVQLYLNNPKAYEALSAPNLDDYIDLMPPESRRQYLVERFPVKETNYSDDDVEKGIVDELYRALLDLQKRVIEVFDRGETEISNDICGMVTRILYDKFKLTITREAPMGYALKRIGETDFFIYSADMSRYYCVCENKLIENFDDALGQLWGYLNFHFQFGVTISINKKFDFFDARKHIKEKLLANAYPAFPFVELRDIGIPYVLKSIHKIPEDDEREFPIYHLILQLKEDERREVARKARQ